MMLISLSFCSSPKPLFLQIKEKVLWTAVCERNEEIVELLLSRGISPSARCLGIASKMGEEKIVQMLLKAGANVNEISLEVI